MSKKILLAEHDKSIADLLHASFQTEGFEPLVATNVPEAVKLFLQQNPDLLVLDYNLSARGALSLLETITKSETGRKLPVIVLGGTEAAKSAERENLESKFTITRFIPKPFRISSLLMELTAILGTVVPAVKPSSKPAAPPLVSPKVAPPSPKPHPVTPPPRPPKMVSPPSPPPTAEENAMESDHIDLIEPDRIGEVEDELEEIQEDEHQERDRSTSMPQATAADRVVDELPREAEPKKKHVIVVDDEVMILKVLIKFLEDEGYQVTSTHKSTEAYKLAVQLKPDLVISDIMMPQLDGYALCKLIKSKPALAATRVMLLTAKNLMQDKGLSFKSGADFFMQKPINRLKLVSVVKSLLSPAVE